VSPNVGQAGQTVTIRGSGLFGVGSSISSVTLAGSLALPVVSNNNTYVTVIAIAGTGGDVVVTSNTGAVVRLINGWTYSQVLSVSPSSGQRGTVVTIAGLGLFGTGSNATVVQLAQTNVAAILSMNSTQIVVIAKALFVSDDLSGFVSITTNSKQTIASSSQLWTYKSPANIQSVTPIAGSFMTVVTITGVNLLAYGSTLVSASLAGVPVQSIVSFNDTEVILVAAASAALYGDVTWMTNTGSQATLADGTARASMPNGAWTYVTPAVIASVQPSIGQVNARVTITGSLMFGGGSSIVSVTLAGVSVASITMNTASSVVVIAAASNATVVGAVVLIADSGAMVTKANAFQYDVPGVISSVVPGSGQVGTVVVISGTGLRGSASNVATVLLGGVLASISSENDTMIVMTISAGATPGPSDVVLTSMSGSTVRQTNGWQQLVEGQITSLLPNVGQQGTLVTVSGARLLGGGASVLLPCRCRVLLCRVSCLARTIRRLWSLLRLVRARAHPEPR